MKFVRSGNPNLNPSRLLLHVTVAIGALFMMLPFFWMLSAAVKEREDIFVLPPVWIPDEILWENFVTVWTTVPMAQAYANSLKIAGLVTIFTLLTSSLAAYAFAKIEFPGKRISFVTLMATMMIPSQATLIPVYILMSRIGWIDTHWPLIVPPALTNAFGVFLLRQFFMSVPDDLIDAARIDGANPFQIYWRVALPIIRPALMALAIFTFLGNWNSFLAPLIYINSRELWTVPLLISNFQDASNVETEWGLLMAASTLALIPVLIVFIFAQRYFIEGVALTGLKG